MCGIWCCISTVPRERAENPVSDTPNLSRHSYCPVCFSTKYKNMIDVQNEFNSRRGPDVSSKRCFQTEDPSAYIHLVSHVLWTQGETAQIQPYASSCGTKLMLFNGDIYSFGDGEPEVDMEKEASLNDGLTLFQLFEQCNSEEEFCEILGNLQGPFVFIFIDIPRGRMMFARDFFGRESLVFSYEDEEHSSWHISSVSVFSHVVEIPTSGMFCLDMKTKVLTVYPYSHERASISTLEPDFYQTLQTSGFVSNVIVCNSKINLHFSTWLRFPETDDEIHKNDVLTSLVSEAKVTSSGEQFIKRSIMHLSSYVYSFKEQLSRSVKRRVLTLPPYCKNCLQLDTHGLTNVSNKELVCNHSKVGVLFSGGVDSTVIAYLAAEQLQPGSTLDLINVAFSKDGNFSNIPDRETALASYKMLHAHFQPQGKFVNLVLVNVGKEEVEEWRRVRIKYLISPLTSVLDDSIGVCLWFAARGVGMLYDNSVGTTTNYASPIRVVLLGSGADECLGGYGRHRSAYEKSGWKGLKSEMQLDFDRISIRNMGRDNRIVSDHGICPRIPFLDERVVDFLVGKCDLWVKCCPVNEGPLGSRGSGEKLLLRALAAKLFGNQYLSLALFPKRAMQFGSKIAKLENSKEKGGDLCRRLQ